MKINIDQIPEAGLELTESCEPTSLDLERADIKFSEPINLLAKISKGADLISVDLKIDATMHLNCSRCLEGFTPPLSKEVKLNLSIENKSEIDITDNLREEIILGHPLKPLCRSACRGLCPSCGRNLNKGKCGCKTIRRKNGFTQKASFKSSTR